MYVDTECPNCSCQTGCVIQSFIKPIRQEIRCVSCKGIYIRSFIYGSWSHPSLASRILDQVNKEQK